MTSLIKNNLNLIQDACKRHHVKSLYLFGSAARDEKQYGLDSDIDFLYKFKKNEIHEMEYADNYFNLLFELRSILNRDVDLVSEEKLSNPYFIKRINQDKLKVYES